MTYQLNQIVKGIKVGTFVIIGFRTVDGDEGVQVKTVNPNDHSRVGRGEMFLPFSAIRPLA